MNIEFKIIIFLSTIYYCYLICTKAFKCAKLCECMESISKKTNDYALITLKVAYHDRLKNFKLEIISFALVDLVVMFGNNFHFNKGALIISTMFFILIILRKCVLNKVIFLAMSDFKNSENFIQIDKLIRDYFKSPQLH